MPRFRRLNIKASKDKGTYVFSNFDIGLYNLDTPRFLGEQLSSLALIGGRNIISEKGALIPQYGYNVEGELPDGEFVAAVSKDDTSTTSFFIMTQAGSLYLFTAGQGLKKYKTQVGAAYNPVVAHSGKHLILFNAGQLYLVGGYYSESLIETINSNITLLDYNSYYQFTVPLSDAEYYWIGKDLAITGMVAGASDTSRHVITSMTSSSEAQTVTIQTLRVDGHVSYENDGVVSIGEKALIERDATYIPEEESEEEVVITPKLMEVCINRLFIVDISGRVYYSQVGGVEVMANSLDPSEVTGFREAYGAGFFEGFYNSTSQVLSIEDFLNGALITKEDGLYYLTLSVDSASNVGTVTDQNKTNTYVKKISNIGQKYAGDHVIVREQVLAYDTWSGSIVEAANVNAFGNMVSGGTIIDQKVLASQSSGIASSKRKLCFNGQENTFFLYYGENLNNGIVLTLNATIFPRQLDKEIFQFIEFNQGVIGVTEDGIIIRDYKPGTVIPNVTSYADFEAIGLRDNRLCCASILEVTELNGVEYSVNTSNAGVSSQKIHPPITRGTNDLNLPPLIYSDKRFGIYNDSFELETIWAEKKSNVTRIYAPMSGRDGVQISLEFPANVSFCLAALRLPDFSQGE